MYLVILQIQKRKPINLHLLNGPNGCLKKGEQI